MPDEMFAYAEAAGAPRSAGDHRRRRRGRPPAGHARRQDHRARARRAGGHRVTFRARTRCCRSCRCRRVCPSPRSPSVRRAPPTRRCSPWRCWPPTIRRWRRRWRMIGTSAATPRPVRPCRPHRPDQPRMPSDPSSADAMLIVPPGSTWDARRWATRPLHADGGAGDGLPRPSWSTPTLRRRPAASPTAISSRPTTTPPRSHDWRRPARWSRPSSRTLRPPPWPGWRATVPVWPSPSAVAVAQDRLIGEVVPPRSRRSPLHRSLRSRPTTDLAAVTSTLTGPAIVKTARLGYDGKGQVSVADVVAERRRRRTGGPPSAGLPPPSNSGSRSTSS